MTQKCYLVYQRKKWYKDQPGYNPADFYDDKCLMLNYDPREKNGGWKFSESSLFFCNLCENNIWDGKLGLKCRKKECQCKFCNDCYPNENVLPKCAQCKHYFCAICVKCCGCKGCGSFVCYKCIQDHESLPYHMFHTTCCVHEFVLNKNHITEDNDEEDNRMTPREQR